MNAMGGINLEIYHTKKLNDTFICMIIINFFSLYLRRSTLTLPKGRNGLRSTNMIYRSSTLMALI